MSDNFVTPIEQVTPGYWWVRPVSRAMSISGGKQTDETQYGEWEIVRIEGTPPLCYIGRFHSMSDNGIRYDAVRNPSSIEFGRKIEEMPD